MIDKVHIPATHKTPEVLLDPEGIIKIKGRAIDESRTTQIPEQIMTWVDSYFLNPAESTEVIIALEFLNSFNTIILTAILKKISQAVPQGKKLVIRWYYEADDVDIFERGEYISITINFPIEFRITDTLTSC
jgi:hypothetical protein